jgi:hypothetical protein
VGVEDPTEAALAGAERWLSEWSAAASGRAGDMWGSAVMGVIVGTCTPTTYLQ